MVKENSIQYIAIVDLNRTNQKCLNIIYNTKYKISIKINKKIYILNLFLCFIYIYIYFNFIFNKFIYLYPIIFYYCSFIFYWLLLSDINC